MSALAPVPAGRLDELEARRLTDEAKQKGLELKDALLRLYDGGAHAALGYSSWADYWEAEFDSSWRHGYRVLDHARVVRVLAPVDPRVNEPTERQARELAPLLSEPTVLREAWEEASADGAPTAAKVREAVAPRMGVHYSSDTDEWETPQDLFDLLNSEFRFRLDVCASKANAKCETFYSREDDGLHQPWDGTCWMNPPYGQEIGSWVAKAWNASKGGSTVVCLVPQRFDTAWAWDHLQNAEVRLLRGRLKFGGGATGAPFPSAVVIFGPGVTPCVKWWGVWR